MAVPLSRRASAGESGDCLNERRIQQIFEISILVKGFDALLECIGGLVLAFISTKVIAQVPLAGKGAASNRLGRAGRAGADARNMSQSMSDAAT